MFTDICGFTEQTGRTSRKDLMERLSTHNSLLLPVIRLWEGKIIKPIGDAFLLTFESPTDALHCALCLQHTLFLHNQRVPEPRQIHIKISVNCGEITVTDTDVFGDPVNVAAKIEKATKPDETYFTEAVFLSMNRSEVRCEHAGSFGSKGDHAPEIELYRLVMDQTDPHHKRIWGEFEKRRATAQGQESTTLRSGHRFALPGFLKRHGKIAGLGAAALIGGAGTSLLLIHNPNATSTPTGYAKPVLSNQETKAVLSVTDHTQLATELPKPDLNNSTQTTTLAWVKSVVLDEAQLKEQSDIVIEKISNEFGELTGKNEELQSLLRTALRSRIYWEARNASFEKATQLLGPYRARFLWIKDWSFLEREKHLGGLHNLARDQWRSVWNDKWVEHYTALKTFSDLDPDFGMRVALEISAINKKHNKVAAPEEQYLVSGAIKLKPALLETERNNLVALAQGWLKIEQEDNGFAREMVRKHFYKEMRPWLVSNLMATNEQRSPPEPEFAWRQNCLALLVDQRDLEALGNPRAYFEKNIPLFLRASETVQWGDGTRRTRVFLTREQISRVFQQPMPDTDKNALIQMLDGMLTEIEGKQGPWADNDDARSTIAAMKTALLTR